MTTELKTAGMPNRGGWRPQLSPQWAKIAGILGLLIVACIYTGFSSDRFLRAGNIENLVHRTALTGILSVGVAFVIITGGIDLSVGSVVCLVGVLLPYLLVQKGWSAPAGVAAVMAIAVSIGAIHGLLVTKMRLQPFVVTLCGLLLYRGIARGITNDVSQGFGNGFKELRSIATGHISVFGLFNIPATTMILIIVAVIAAIVLNKTIYGRYLLALGNNAEAARYSGINVDRTTLIAYVICSTLAGLGGMLYVLDFNVAQPSVFGNAYELYAIAAAVLGGCSLRGGEGSITGVVIGAAVIVVIQNAILLVHKQFQNIDLAIIGGVILIGVVVDEIARRIVAARRAASQRAK